MPKTQLRPDVVAALLTLTASGTAPEKLQTKASLSGRDGFLGDRLRQALATASASRELIKEAQDVLRRQPYRDNSEIERAAREYQIELVEWQLSRAADLATERIAYFETLTTQAAWDAENARCGDGLTGLLHWFHYYAWGFDPRPAAPLNVMPLGLFDIQSGYVKWVYNLIFERRSSGLVEKSRDMGATVIAVAIFIWCWKYIAGFSALFTTSNEDLVDSKRDPDTLFEKARFCLRLLPEVMLPKGFNIDRDMPYMNLANPVNGSSITGSAPTTRVGRGGRKTAILCDEFQTYPNGGYPQHTAMSQTTLSMLMLGTPEGKYNKYAELRRSGHVSVYEMDWREHPWKDQRWYDALPLGFVGPSMSPEQIAQEIDRNYDASQPGKVFRNVREEYLFITWDEMVAGFERLGVARSSFYNPAGQPRVPQDWEWGRQFDYGQTDAHPWIITHEARPRVAYPLNDTVFVFSSHRITPTGATIAQGFDQWRAIETRLGWRKPYTKEFVVKPQLSECSHEADDAARQKGVRSVLLREHGDNWNAWNTDYALGLPQMQEWFMLIETDRENPFRPVLSGRTRIVFVALPSPQGQEYELALNERAGEYFVTPSRTENGYRLLREELTAYHYPKEEQGKPLAKMRPFKLMDDTIDTLRALACRWGPSAGALTKPEKEFRALSPENQSRARRKDLNEQEKTDLMIEVAEVRERMRPPRSDYDDSFSFL